MQTEIFVNTEPMTTSTMQMTIDYSRRAAGDATLSRRWACSDEEYHLRGRAPHRVLDVKLPTRIDRYFELNAE